MSVVNLREKSINAKIVYYGPPLGGKTTSLKHIHRVMDPERRTSLISLNTERDRTLFFDFLPINLGRIGDFTLKIQGFTVPGQVKYLLTRRYVLRGADAVVFVADSQVSEREANLQSLTDLRENLRVNGLDYRSIPLVFQYNKRDAADLLTVEALDSLVNERLALHFETVATAGKGVFEAFVSVTSTMVHRICAEYRIGGGKDVAGGVEATLLRLAAASAAAPAAPDAPQAAPAPGDRPPVRDAVVVVEQPDDADPLRAAEALLEQAVGTNIQIADLLTQVNEARGALGESLAELQALHAVSSAAASVLDEDRVVRAVVEGAATALHTGYASVLLVDAADEGREGEGGEVRERGVHGFLYDPLLAGSSAGDGAAFLGLLRAEGPVIVDGTGPPGVLDAIRAREAGVFAAVAAPLRVRGEAQGLLVVYWVGGGPVPGEAAVRFLGALAAGAAVALENARLHARLGRFNRELEGRVAERTRDLEKALRELRALDRLKDDFLSSMSHELMTPLAGVRSSAEILRSYADLSQQEREDFLLGIEHETDRLSDRLQDILDLAAFDAGKVVLQRDPANVREVLVAALEKARPAFEARRLKTQLWLPQAELPRLPCDRRWLDRALAHVLDNAAKFSPEGAEVVVSGESDGKAIVFRVRDRGPGIRPEDRESLFQRFKQLGSVETDKPPGIGAGLPLVRRIAEAHGGTVGLEGGPGLGTLVELRLPLT